MQFVEKLNIPIKKAASPCNLARAIWDDEDTANCILECADPYVYDECPYTGWVERFKPVTEPFDPNLLCKSIQHAIGVTLDKAYTLDHPLVHHTVSLLSRYMEKYEYEIDKAYSEKTLFYHKNDPEAKCSGRIDLVLINTNTGNRMVCEIKTSQGSDLLSEKLDSCHPIDQHQVAGFKCQVTDYINLLSGHVPIDTYALVINVTRCAVELYIFDAGSEMFYGGHTYLSAIKVLRDAKFVNRLRYRCTICQAEFIRAEGASTHCMAKHL